jgi:nitroimidazol reductase NimA-like FMN-containing flavoprotein (pyridoxamine 5'-phosphate oxidase superfamily)
MPKFHVRRRDREITETAEMFAVLKAAKYVTIALSMNNEPYLVSLSHGYDEENRRLYFHCASEGKKLVYVMANPKVWGQVILDFGVTDECDYAYTSVHFWGTMRIVDELAEKQNAMAVLVRQQSRTPEAKLAKISAEKLAKTTMLSIDIDGLTGKKYLNPKVVAEKP